MIKNNLFNDKGIMRWPDHRIYEGEFKFDKMDGDGVNILYLIEKTIEI